MRKEKKSKKALFLAVLIVLLGSSVWLLFFSKFFQIKKIIFQEENSQPKAISLDLPSQKIIGLVDISKNILFLKKDFIKQKFATPQVKEIKILKDYKNREIFIKISKRKEELIWCLADLNEENKNCFLVDKEGVAFKDSAFVKGIDEPVVVQYLPTSTKKSISLGKNIAVSKEVSFIEKVYKRFLPFFDKLTFTIMPEDREKLVVNNGKFDIYFNTKEDCLRQLNAFERVYEKLSKESLNLTYIDLQSLPRVYYK